MKGEIFIFINFDQAAGFGHIGWGLLVGGERYYFGSTDHLWNTDYPMWHPLELIRYMNVEPGENNDFWAELGSFDDMLQTMRHGHHVRYHAYKAMPVESAEPLMAKAYAEQLAGKGWNVFFDNCVHQTFHILTKYGATQLPDPYKLSNRVPRAWFDSIEADPILISKPRRKVVIPTFDTTRGDRRAG
ncbi:MAG TPA: hypothetical protein V6C81_29725 [Planktothrix sp.]|jgi:hypothetical protein